MHLPPTHPPTHTQVYLLAHTHTHKCSRAITFSCLCACRPDCYGAVCCGVLFVRNTPSAAAFLSDLCDKYSHGFWVLGPMTALQETVLEWIGAERRRGGRSSYEKKCASLVFLGKAAYEVVAYGGDPELAAQLELKHDCCFHRHLVRMVGTYRRRQPTPNIRLLDPTVVGVHETRAKRIGTNIARWVRFPSCVRSCTLPCRSLRVLRCTDCPVGCCPHIVEPSWRSVCTMLYI